MAPPTQASSGEMAMSAPSPSIPVALELVGRARRPSGLWRAAQHTVLGCPQDLYGSSPQGPKGVQVMLCSLPTGDPYVVSLKGTRHVVVHRVGGGGSACPCGPDITATTDARRPWKSAGSTTAHRPRPSAQPNPNPPGRAVGRGRGAHRSSRSRRPASSVRVGMGHACSSWATRARGSIEWFGEVLTAIHR